MFGQKLYNRRYILKIIEVHNIKFFWDKCSKLDCTHSYASFCLNLCDCLIIWIDNVFFVAFPKIDLNDKRLKCITKSNIAGIGTNIWKEVSLSYKNKFQIIVPARRYKVAGHKVAYGRLYRVYKYLNRIIRKKYNHCIFSQTPKQQIRCSQTVILISILRSLQTICLESCNEFIKHQTFFV